MVFNARAVLYIAQWVMPIIGIFLNSVEMYLVFFATDKRMSDYKPILLQTCLVDIFNCITTFVTKFQLEYKVGNFYILIGSLSPTEPTWLVDLFAQVWVFGLFYSVCTCPVQFVYRYILLIHNRSFSRCYYVSMMTLAFLSALSYAILNFCSFYFMQKADGDEYYLLAIDENYAGGIPAFIVTDVNAILLKIHLAIGLLLVATAYGIMIYTTVRMFHKLNNMRSKMSAHLFRMQKQMNLTLFLNATIPCISYLIPITISFILTFTRSNIPGMGEILSLVITIYPVANPLVAILVIRHYRRSCVLIIRKILFLKTNTTEVIGSDANSAIKQSTMATLNGKIVPQNMNVLTLRD